MCYFAALIEGLRLIDAKAAERPGIDVTRIDYDPLIHYVQVKGSQIATAAYGSATVPVANLPNGQAGSLPYSPVTIIEFPRAA